MPVEGGNTFLVRDARKIIEANKALLKAHNNITLSWLVTTLYASKSKGVR